MKLYGFYTPSHEILKDEWFLPSVGDEYELVLRKYDQECDGGIYGNRGFIRSVSHKFDILIEATKENWGETFVFSDMDLQFFRPSKEKILNCIGDKDIVFQRNHPNGVVCTGFFACRGNEKTLRLWEDAKKLIQKYFDTPGEEMHDQTIINILLCIEENTFSLKKNRCRVDIKTKLNRLVTNSAEWCFGEEKSPYLLCMAKRIFGGNAHPQAQDFSDTPNPYEIHWGYLPNEFFGGATLTGRYWGPGIPLEVPDNIVMHHANFIRGNTNKIAQLSYVRKIVEERPALVL